MPLKTKRVLEAIKENFKKKKAELEYLISTAQEANEAKDGELKRLRRYTIELLSVPIEERSLRYVPKMFKETN